MDAQNINLARKWRSKNFDQIVGQELSVKMLKNSLYLNHYFPVYLFSGQKGCGKTSTARVFAAAINCDELPKFQADPKNALLPCLQCHSCRALSAGQHPDFIEIDAASHTGVENVRQIIDSSALLPLMGRKKIYLIDEAHMLSKAAFNAFLKLMEEPPASVIFILATTDTQKIIETVRSRSFQIFFKPIDHTLLCAHLARVCQIEGISANQEALSLIVKETGGCARDAINLLEQVRFSDSQVTKESVYQVLGHLDEVRLLHLFEILLYKTPADFLKFCQEHELEKFSTEYVWARICELLRACLWIKNGITPRTLTEYSSQLQFLTRGKSVQQITALLDFFYSNESVFRKTTAQYAFLEVMLLRICQKNESNSNSSMPAAAPPPTFTTSESLEALEESDFDDESEDELPQDDQINALWKKVITQIELLQDPLLESIFKQGTFISFDDTAGLLTAEFPKELTFFSDIIETTKAQWQPLLQQVFLKKIEIKALFVIPAKTDVLKSEVLPAPIKQKMYAAQPTYSNPKSMNTSLREPQFTISDWEQWPQAALLLKHFPGTITQIKEIV